MKYLSATILIILTVALTGCDSDNDKQQDALARIKNLKKITVGYISYFDITKREGNTGEVRGFLVDVLNEVMKDLDISKDDIKFVETDWANFGLGLQSGKYDLSIAGTFNTDVRAKVVNFSRPIFYLGNGLLVKQEDNRFHSIEDCDKDGITVAVVQGEQGYEYARKYFTKAKIIALSGSDLSLAPLQVQMGKADVALSDQYILRRYCDKNSGVKDALIDNPYDILPICWSVSKEPGDSSLLVYINEQLIKMENSGTLQKIINEYPMIPFAKAPLN